MMNNKYRNNIESYLLAMHHAGQLLSIQVITPTEYAKIDTIMANKYGLSSCSIYRPNSLINNGFSGNMLVKVDNLNLTTKKEVDYE